MVDVIDLTSEDVYRKLARAEAHPLLVEVFVEQHESLVALQKLVNELMAHNRSLLEAVKLAGLSIKAHSEKLQKIEKKFGDEHKDLVIGSKLDG